MNLDDRPQAAHRHTNERPADTRPRHGTTKSHSMPQGAQVLPDDSVRFRVWAPTHDRIGLDIARETEPLAMTSAGDGWYELTTSRAKPGTEYRFVLPDGSRIPDPASRFQPHDVYGPSEVIDPTSYEWRHASWRGRPWHETVLYELHIGAFTPGGTFRAAIDKLDHLVELGVTAIEIMPIAEFPGACNWGYDGVLPYAPDASYGRPEDFKALIDAAHASGLMVLLDVVYNHFGPDGNYLPACAPAFFTERHKTPWGAAINYDGQHSKAVRDFVVHNALYWIEEFHLDGLRLDAVHAIIDDSARHVLIEIAERVREFAGERHVHLLLENEKNQARLLSRDGGQARLYTAQWNDDVHHVLHTNATGESSGYYQEYCCDTHKLGRALAEGFVFQGERMEFSGIARGEASSHLPPLAFVAFIQNHDQIGNRAFGERIGALASKEAVRAIASVYLLLPQVPMLFMGEEWDAAQPFPFFCDFADELAEAVRNGRREEFARFPEFADPQQREKIPDPQAPSTFASAKLMWSDASEGWHADQLSWYRQILSVRRKELTPRLPQIAAGGTFKIVAQSAVMVQWPLAGANLILCANLSNEPVQFPAIDGRLIWQTGTASGNSFSAWSVRWFTANAQ